MQRSFVNKQKSDDLHFRWQKDIFDYKRVRLIEKAEEKLYPKNPNTAPEPEKFKEIMREVNKMVFQFQGNNSGLNFGKCKKKGTFMDFIPGILMDENRECFEHRRS